MRTFSFATAKHVLHADPHVAERAGAMLAMRGICKAFGANTVLRDVSLACHAGEVHAICGENGAGKSTLMKILGGIHKPDAGEILIDGKQRCFDHPAEARNAGVAVIHQELALLPYRTVAENIFLGREPTRYGVVDRKRMHQEARKVLARIGSDISPEAACGTLSLAERQTVEIAKAISTDARILVLDEPTAALDDMESEKLFRLIADLQRAGVSMLYISHRMAEVMRLASRITVIKDGRLMATMARSEATVDRIVRLMVGRELSDFYPPPPVRRPDRTIYEVVGGRNGQLADINFAVRAGEIVGVAGLEASGKYVLAAAMFGVQRFEGGVVTTWDGLGAPSCPREAARRGIGFVPADRKHDGLGLNQSLRDNAALALRSLAPAVAGAMRGDRSQRRIDALLDDVEVRAADFDMAVGGLSGGNQQKVLLARWIAAQPKLLIVCEPTRGVDVGAKATIYRFLRAYADAGGAVVVVSSDVAEIIGLSDRICVMALGRIAAEFPRGATEEAIIAQAVRHDL
jgi:ribose transport system ATP-binding protein